jgi:hypothetical protein
VTINMPAISPDGSALWPDQWPVSELREKERTMSKEAWAAQYQQAPLAGTATTGRVYKEFSRKNVRPCKYEPGLPLTLSLDFNVDGQPSLPSTGRAGTISRTLQTGGMLTR